MDSQRKTIITVEIDDSLMESGMPATLVRHAITMVDQALADKINATMAGNSPDFVSAVYYYGKSKGADVRLYLYGKLSTFEEVFAEFNKAFAIIDEAVGNYEEEDENSI